MLSSRPISVHTDFPQDGTYQTPGRALHNRAALRENVGTVRGGGGGKKAIFQTPLKGLGDSHPAKTPAPSKGAGAGGKGPVLTIGRPLGDKTPFPNRGLNGAFPLANTELDGTLLPSSARKSLRRSIRGSGSLGFGGLNLASLGLGKFQTPRVNGNPWDVEEVDMEAPTEEALDVLQEEVEVEDFDEFEYMPPTAIEPAYQPSFDMPDYKTLGRTLATFHHSFQTHDVPPYPEHTHDEEHALLEPALVVLPELTPEDTKPFYFSRTPSPPPAPILAATTRSVVRQVPTGSSSRPLTRTATLPPAKSSTTTAIARSATSSRLDTHKPTSSTSRTPVRPVTSMARPMTSMARRAPEHSGTHHARPATSMARARPETSMARVAPASGTNRLAPSASQPRIAGSASQSRLATGKAVANGATTRPNATASRIATGPSTSRSGQTKAKTQGAEDLLLIFDTEDEDFRFEV